MTTPVFPSLIDEQIAELPEVLALPDGQVLMVFKGPTMHDAMRAAADGFIANPEAWHCRACLCGEWTVGYQVQL